MNTEQKSVLQLLVVIIPLFAVLVVVWLIGPTHVEISRQEREQARLYLVKTYYMNIPDRYSIMEYYGFTEADIKPDILEKPCNQNLGALK